MSPSRRPQIVVSDVDPAWGAEGDDRIHLVLVNPEIPANTGNIARLCAGTGTVLHLVEPLGFALQDRYLKRAGLDYWPRVTLCVHSSWECIDTLFHLDRLCLLSTHTKKTYTDAPMGPGTVFVMGRETKGLGPDILHRYPDRVFRIPITNDVRSLNLANACAVVLYEAYRRMGWPSMC